ncbi:unnamed protein product [Prunus brigantina]
MSDTESDYSRSPRAFDGETASESTTEGLESADFEETERGAPDTEEDVTVADPGEGVLTVVRGPQRIPMAKPKELVFGVDHLEPNIMTEAELAKIRALYNIPDSVKMRIPGPLESLSNPTWEAVFFTDVFKHGLRLPLRHSVQKILAAIGYAPGQFNPNFWITLLGTITAFGIAGEGEPSYEQFAHLYSVTRAKSADQGGWLAEDLASASGIGIRSLGIGSGVNCGEAHSHIFPNNRFVGCAVSLKRPIATRREIEVIERVRSLIPEEDRFHKSLLDFKNLYRAGLISEPEYLRRKEEEGEKESLNTFCLQANMEMWLGMKRAVNTAERVQKKFEDGRAKIVEAGKMLQDADRHAEENAAKIAELSSKLAEEERAVVDAEEARARAEAEKDAALRSQAAAVEEAKKKAVDEYRSSEEFGKFLDKEPPPLPERVTEEMVEAYLGEDAETDSSSGSESGCEDEDTPPEQSSVRETEGPAQTAADAVPQTP